MQRSTTEQRAQQAPAPSARTEHVAVSYEHFLSVQVEQLERASVQRDAAFGTEVVVCPQIVIAGEKMDGNTPVGQSRQSAQQARESARNDPLVLVPEIEDVADQKNSLGVGRHFV